MDPLSWFISQYIDRLTSRHAASDLLSWAVSISVHPLQNRVTPLGEILAIPERGALMGNRGCLHDHEGVIRRRWKEHRWIICQLSYKGHVVPLREPGLYTPLFFKDEASALAAGHRPCATCRRDAYSRFLRSVEAGHGLNPGSLKAAALDALLHEERTLPLNRRNRLPPSETHSLPDGSMIAISGVPFLVEAGKLTQWSWNDREEAEQVVTGEAILLTPPSTVRALQNGYRPLT